MYLSSKHKSNTIESTPKCASTQFHNQCSGDKKFRFDKLWMIATSSAYWRVNANDRTNYFSSWRKLTMANGYGGGWWWWWWRHQNNTENDNYISILYEVKQFWQTHTVSCVDEIVATLDSFIHMTTHSHTATLPKNFYRKTPPISFDADTIPLAYRTCIRVLLPILYPSLSPCSSCTLTRRPLSKFACVCVVHTSNYVHILLKKEEKNVPKQH